MTTAVDNLIANLEGNWYSRGAGAQFHGSYQLLILALQEIQGGLTPSGPEAANTFYAGPASGVAALPTFRTMVSADMFIATALARGAVKPDGTIITVSGTGAITVPIATNAALGVVKPDGTTITIAGDGTLTATFGADGANPTATAGPNAVNGVATTFMRSDAAPAIQKASAAQFGIVEVDGTTITSAAGVISAAAGVGPFLALAGGVMAGTETFADGSAFSATGLAMAVGKTITPAQLAGIVGTTTNNDAQAGSFGEYIQKNVGSGSAVPFVTTNVPINVASQLFGAGDWDIQGGVFFENGTVTTGNVAWLSTTSVTVPSDVEGGLTGLNVAFAAGGIYIAQTGVVRFSFAAPTTVFLSARATFAGTPGDAFGKIRARRIR